MHRISMAIAALAVALPAASLAAQAPDTVPLAPDTPVVALPAVEVWSSILPAAGPRIGSGIPARARVVSGGAIDAWEPRLLANALAAEPGVSLYDDLGSAAKTTLVMRGFTASPVVGLPQGVSVFLDGVPLNEPDARQVNWDLLPMEHVERVELLHGTASLLGPNALGGAVNLVTRLGAGEPEAEVEVAAGSFGERSAEAAVSGGAGGWSYYAGTGYERDSGWREDSSAEGYNGFVNLGRLGAERGLRVQAFAANSYAETAGSLPLSVYSVRPRVNLTAGDFEDLQQLHLAVAGYGGVGAGRGSFNVWARGHDAERFNVNQATDPDVRSFSENRTAGATLDWRWTGPASGGVVGFRGGASGTVNRSSIRIFAERIDPGQTTHVESPISEAGVFGLLDYTRGRLSFSGGARLDAIRIPFRNRLDPDRDTTSLYVQLNPRAGVRWQAARGASLYASAGQSFRAPAVIELACADPENPCPLPFALGDDPPLDPVTAVTWEAGGSLLRGPASLNASVYRTDVRDDIFLFPYEEDDEPVGSTIDGFFANIEATRRQGVELDSRVVLPGGHSAFATYAYTRATFQVDDVELFSIREEAGGENEVEEGDRLPLVPDHTVSAGADFLLPYGVQLGVLGRYTGERYLRGDEANEEEPLGGYFVADLRAGYEFKGWEVQALVHNALDNEYAAFGTFNLYQAGGGVLERFLTPGRPRSLKLIVQRSFGG